MCRVVLQYLCYIIDKNIGGIRLFLPGRKAAFPRVFPIVGSCVRAQIHFTLYSVPNPLRIYSVIAQPAPKIYICANVFMNMNFEEQDKINLMIPVIHNTMLSGKRTGIPYKTFLFYSLPVIPEVNQLISNYHKPYHQIKTRN